MASRGWIKDDNKVAAFAYREEDITNKGVYINLMRQLNRLAKHTKGGLGIRTQRQYYNHMDQFTRFLADDFGLQNLSNIHGRHIAAYIEERQSEGLSASAIDLDLSAIRYFHDQYGSEVRNRIPENVDLCKRYGITLDLRSYGKVNRRWTDTEIAEMTDLAMRKGRTDIAKIIQLGAGLGPRIHEITRLSRPDALRAIRTGFLHVKGKNGLERDIPLRGAMADLLKATASSVSGDAKLFVPQGRKTHEIIQSVQDFIRNHRDKVAEQGVRSHGVRMTFHGLRHRYAFDRYQEFRGAGFTAGAARLMVSKLIGHRRDEITRIYLGETTEEDAE
ncbi:site-specific recombinase XerD [Paenibacillus taihuensis]|uniref:Site-specific recombinase XerD n=1 Tax=Paenibacillus taihuensis TaxID=1156355 RepID=A0A3D9SCB8_9BACL|nr:tyrosine-type recombinase/integrase [Paenibacillus taihuensis]REE90615.1 site-specific recombinase XerD [Paenibacillus taihuensis]